METFDRKKVIQLLVGIVGIYSIYSITGLLQESVIKSKYLNDTTGQLENLEYPYVQLIFVGFCSFVMGQIYNRATLPSSQIVSIPWRHGFKCGFAVVLITICYSYAIKITNFPVVMMIRSCSLLSVVLYGVLFTGVSDTSLKLGYRKIVVAVIVTLGMIVFKVYDPNQKKDQHVTQLFGIALMILSLIGEGILPDFQAIIKQTYAPGPTVMLAFVNKWTFIVSILFSIVAGHFPHIVNFMIHHNRILIDNILIGVLCFVGQVFIYRIVKQFKQHIVPFIITTRKIFTIGLSIAFYGHDYNFQQIIGIFIVFGASAYEFVSELRKDFSRSRVDAGKNKEEEQKINKNRQEEENKTRDRLQEERKRD